MAADLSTLTDSFRHDYTSLLEACAGRGLPMVCFFTIRTPQEQARFWRQSRTRARVDDAIERLRSDGAPWLASVLEGVGPCDGRWLTNALPGNSWHQWGEAGDAYASVNGNASWMDPRNEPPDMVAQGKAAYDYYAAKAEELSLRSLGSIGDWPHVQARQESSPHRVMTWPDIDTQMQRRFGPIDWR